MGVTSVYVTHDRDEAFAMGDRLAFMNEGAIVRSGTPQQVFDDPGDEFVARSLGFKNILAGNGPAYRPGVGGGVRGRSR